MAFYRYLRTECLALDFEVKINVTSSNTERLVWEYD